MDDKIRLLLYYVLPRLALVFCLYMLLTTVKYTVGISLNPRFEPCIDNSQASMSSARESINLLPNVRGIRELDKRCARWLLVLLERHSELMGSNRCPERKTFLLAKTDLE